MYFTVQVLETVGCRENLIQVYFLVGLQEMASDLRWMLTWDRGIENMKKGNKERMKMVEFG